MRVKRESAIAATVIAVALAIGLAGPASALGSGTATCNWGAPGYSWTRHTYQSTFSNAGGNTARASSACFADYMGISLHYRSYPGGPSYWTGFYYGTYAVYRTQSGTFGGAHSLHYGGGVVSYGT